jgi:murein DD-endopeptidase MepM/ murein hydrolase activator NlpD
MQGILRRRGVALALASCLLLGLIVAGAGATNSIKQAKAQQHGLRLRVESLHYRRDRMRGRFHHRIHAARRRVEKAIFKLRAAVVDARVAGQAHSRGHVARLRTKVRRLQRHRKRIALAIHARVLAIQAQSTSLQNWIDTNGIFQYCPVDGPNALANNFGIIVRLPGVPIHVHEGDDISAAAGTPIVAPFDGLAVATRSVLAGLAVEVFGPLGHVFNAHLSSYGHLGAVHAGEIIGYVGMTGDATGPHDHFEWHPGNGPAVDPQPYLEKVC